MFLYSCDFVIKFGYKASEVANLKGMKIGCGRLVIGRILCQLRTADKQGEDFFFFFKLQLWQPKAI